MPSYAWKALEHCLEQKLVTSIGVSNHDVPDLVRLLSYAKIRPSVNQVEAHPLVPLNQIKQYCQDHGIKVEGHTILTNSRFLSSSWITKVAENNKCTPAQVMTKYVLQFGFDVCVSSTNASHLKDLIRAQDLNLSTDDLSTLASGLTKTPYRFYPIKGLPHPDDETPQDEVETYLDQTARQLLKDFKAMKAKEEISSLALSAPSAKKKNHVLGRKLALRMFSINEKTGEKRDEASCYQKYNSHIRLVRRRLNEEAAQALIAKKKEKRQTCTLRRRPSIPAGPTAAEAASTETMTPSSSVLSSIGSDSSKNHSFEDRPISREVAIPEPMPVEIAPEGELLPFMLYLNENNPLNSDTVFLRGALFADGRMDLCKQVVGPTHIKKLCQAVKQNQSIKHFLLGNNIACHQDQSGAIAMAEVIESNQPIETWYLAGNCIDAEGIKHIAQALTKNTTAKALWLKRNPITAEGALHLGEMLTQNSTLTVLDLDNCAIFDQGIYHLFSPSIVQSVDGTNQSNLKHLYLDANALTEKGAGHLALYLWSCRDRIKSLYLSINRLRNNGVYLIISALLGSPSLKRISFGSNELDDRISEMIYQLAISCPKLICLDLGYYKSTFDMGECPNRFTDLSVPTFAKICNEHPTLEFFDVTNNALTLDGVNNLFDSLTQKAKNQVTIFACQFDVSGNHTRLTNHTKEALRRIRHPKRVKDIDSMYRNKM
jgi:Ran GTPase-activating protein (RanGAP) involved in mRNA processing and transport